MDTSNHYAMNTLFEQMGLPAEPQQIEAFVQSHRLAADVRIQDAAFWNSAQKAFLSESINEDSDWVELIDHLDTQLRK